MTKNYLSIHHSSLIVADTQASLAFYSDILGFQQLERPNLPFLGAWLAVGDSQQLHLLELDNPDSTTGRPDHGGRDRHVAINIKDLDITLKLLKEKNVHFSLSLSGRRALFCRDLDGNALEFIEQQN